MNETIDILDERKDSIQRCNKKGGKGIACEKDSVAGSVSQRACVYCGSRVVLNPITDALHVVHGPIGCASYTWDIRGSLSSGVELHRNSFSTDLKESDVIFGGEKKLSAALDEIIPAYNPKAVFVYATCIVGIIGDDIEAVCKKAEKKWGIRVIPVQSSGFAGNKMSGYKAACKSLLDLMEYPETKLRSGINILGDFNLAGEIWIITGYLAKMGINVVAKLTGDGSIDHIKKAPSAALNIVQCAGSMTHLAMQMEEKFDIPFIKVSFFGIEDTARSLLDIAKAVGNQETLKRTYDLIKELSVDAIEQTNIIKQRLIGKKAAIYVGGGFKAISLIKQFETLGMKTVLVGTQTGRKEEYETIQGMVEKGTVIIDDSTPSELEKYMLEMKADILVGGVKERFLAYKLGIAFCDHNHERKYPLNGFEGAVNFAKEIDLTINSPVWKYAEAIPDFID